MLEATIVQVTFSLLAKNHSQKPMEGAKVNANNYFFQLVNETSGKNKVVNLLNNSSEWKHHKRSNGYGAQTVIVGATGPGC